MNKSEGFRFFDFQNGSPNQVRPTVDSKVELKDARIALT